MHLRLAPAARRSYYLPRQRHTCRAFIPRHEFTKFIITPPSRSTTMPHELPQHRENIEPTPRRSPMTIPSCRAFPILLPHYHRVELSSSSRAELSPRTCLLSTMMLYWRAFIIQIEEERQDSLLAYTYRIPAALLRVETDGADGSRP